MSHHEGHDDNVSHSVYGTIFGSFIVKAKERYESKGPKPYSNPYYAGIGLGIILFISFFIVGKGLGGSGAFARLHAFTMDSLFPAFTEQAPYFKRYLSTTTHILDDWLVYMTVGLFVGGAVSGLLGRRMKIELIKGPNASTSTRVALAFIGGIIVAVGGRIAGGCTSGLAITGSALLGAGGWSFLMSMFVSGTITAFIFRKHWL